MTSFIYCTDELIKNDLISKGCKLITTQQLNNQLTWVFEHKPDLQFDFKDTSKCFTNDILMF